MKTEADYKRENALHAAKKQRERQRKYAAWERARQKLEREKALKAKHAVLREARAKKENERAADGRTLIIDIETSPIVGLVWGVWKQNLSIDQIQQDWSILSYAAKWADEPKIFYEATGGHGAGKVRDDSGLLPGLWKLLNEAERVVAQNGNKFDIKKINYRLVERGYDPPKSYRVYDTLLASRRLFAATSHKLGWLSEHLTDTPKSKHRKFPGWELWLECLKDNPAAWAEMKKYNIQDIKATEKLWRRQQAWVRNRPMLGTYDK